MAIGLNISDNVRVELGEIKEELLNDLSNNNILYNIPFDKTNSNNIKETIIQIPDILMEISVENDIVTYIKSANNNYTHLDTVDITADNPVEVVKSIQQKINDKFKGNSDSIKIEKLDIKTMNIIVILISKTQKVRAVILRDAIGDIYINTLRIL